MFGLDCVQVKKDQKSCKFKLSSSQVELRHKCTFKKSYKIDLIYFKLK